MSASPTAAQAEHYTIADVTSPRGVVRVIRDHWWWCLDGDHRQAVIYTGKPKSNGQPRFYAPQCNSHRAITERIPVPFASAQVCQIPLAFVPAERD